MSATEPKQSTDGIWANMCQLGFDIPSRIAPSSNALSPAVLALPETDGENAIEQRFVVDASSFGGFGEFLAVADIGIRVGLKKVRSPLGIEAEVHARVAAELQQTIQALGRLHQEPLHLRRQVSRRADLDAATLLELEVPLYTFRRDPGRIGAQPPHFQLPDRQRLQA